MYICIFNLVLGDGVHLSSLKFCLLFHLFQVEWKARELICSLDKWLETFLRIMIKVLEIYKSLRHQCRLSHNLVSIFQRKKNVEYFRWKLISFRENVPVDLPKLARPAPWSCSCPFGCLETPSRSLNDGHRYDTSNAQDADNHPLVLPTELSEQRPLSSRKRQH